jgi:hypothetical protein
MHDASADLSCRDLTTPGGGHQPPRPVDVDCVSRPRSQKPSDLISYTYLYFISRPTCHESGYTLGNSRAMRPLKARSRVLGSKDHWPARKSGLGTARAAAVRFLHVLVKRGATLRARRRRSFRLSHRALTIVGWTHSSFRLTPSHALRTHTHRHTSHHNTYTHTRHMCPRQPGQSSETSGPSISRARSAMPSVIPSGAAWNFCMTSRTTLSLNSSADAFSCWSRRLG